MAIFYPTIEKINQFKVQPSRRAHNEEGLWCNGHRGQRLESRQLSAE